MGAKLEAADEFLLKGFAESLCSLYGKKKQIETYIQDSMESTAPNLSLVAGPMLGARLISLAGSLEKLAAFPSSTIQVIGTIFCDKNSKGFSAQPTFGKIASVPFKKPF